MEKIPWRTQVRAYFITGFLTIVPVMATIFLITIAMKILFKFFGSPFLFLLKMIFHVKLSENWIILSNILGIFCGIFCVLIIITLSGLLIANILGRTLFVWFETFLIKLPLISSFYGAVKQLMEMFFSTGKNSFTRVVLVEYPRKGVYCIGFVTAEDNLLVGNVTDAKMVNVYLSAAFHVASGFMIVVPVKDVITLKMSVEDGLKLVASGGIISPDMAKEGTVHNP